MILNINYIISKNEILSGRGGFLLYRYGAIWGDYKAHVIDYDYDYLNIS